MIIISIISFTVSNYNKEKQKQRQKNLAIFTEEVLKSNQQRVSGRQVQEKRFSQKKKENLDIFREILKPNQQRISEIQTVHEEHFFQSDYCSFSYNDDWKVEEETLEEDLMFQITLEKKENNAEMGIMLIKADMTDYYSNINEWLQESIEGLKEEPFFKKAKFASFYNQ